MSGILTVKMAVDMRYAPGIRTSSERVLDDVSDLLLLLPQPPHEVLVGGIGVAAPSTTAASGVASACARCRGCGKAASRQRCRGRRDLTGDGDGRGAQWRGGALPCG